MHPVLGTLGSMHTDGFNSLHQPTDASYEIRTAQVSQAAWTAASSGSLLVLTVPHHEEGKRSGAPARSMAPDDAPGVWS